MDHAQAGFLGYLKIKDHFDKQRDKKRNEARERFKDKRCAGCNNHMPYEKRYNKFCTKRCYVETSLIGNERSKKYDRPDVCIHCKVNPIGKNAFKYCSHKCQRDAQYKALVADWKAGRSSGTTATIASKYVKRYLIETYGEKCSECGWSKRHPVTGKVPVQVDHIDGNWKNGVEANLRLLCPNCHSLTPTFGGLNRGKGRGKNRPDSRK